MQSLLKGVIDAIFPPNCILCQQYYPEHQRSPLCPSCFEKLSFNTPPFCLKCSRHLSSHSFDGICPICKKQRPFFDQAISLLNYQQDVQLLLHHFKFHHKTSLRHCFEIVLKKFLHTYPFFFDPQSIIIPIPIHPIRLRERGFHHTLLLSESFARILHFPIMTNILKYYAYIPHQTGLSQKERFTNIQGAFKIKNSSDIRNACIILIDDLLTTGATVNEASHVLKLAGAKHITVLTLAIT